MGSLQQGLINEFHACQSGTTGPHTSHNKEHCVSALAKTGPRSNPQTTEELLTLPTFQVSHTLAVLSTICHTQRCRKSRNWSTPFIPHSRRQNQQTSQLYPCWRQYKTCHKGLFAFSPVLMMKVIPIPYVAGHTRFLFRVSSLHRKPLPWNIHGHYPSSIENKIISMNSFSPAFIMVTDIRHCTNCSSDLICHC